MDDRVGGPSSPYSLLANSLFAAHPRGIFGRNTASNPIAGRKAQTW